MPTLLLTDVAVLPLPARLTDAGPVVALAVLLAARVTRPLVACGADPALLALAMTLGADAVAAARHGAQLCRRGRQREETGCEEREMLEVI